MASFLKNFRTFTECSEVHPNHAMWAALVAMSAVVGRKVHLPLGPFTIYPNLYVVFVAPPGGRKSTAMDFTGAFLEQFGLPVTYDSVTKERLVGTMAKNEVAFQPLNGDPPFVYSPLTILSTELSEIVGPSKDSMISFLTTLFDKKGDYKNSTIKRGDEHIVSPYLVLLGCTTPAWITARLRDDVISGGFSRRAIFVYEDEEPERKAIPVVTEEMKSAWDEAVAYAKEKLAMAYGPFRWAPEAQAKYVDWYENQVIPKDPYLTGYFRSKHIQVMKIAQLVSLSESANMVIELHHWDFAFQLLGLIEGNLHRVFEGVGRNELNASASILVDMIRQAGGYLAEKQCYNLMFAHCQEYEIKQIIEHLVNSEKLVKAAINNTKTGLAISCLFTQQGFKRFQTEIDYARRNAEATAQAGLLRFGPSNNAGSPPCTLPGAIGGGHDNGTSSEVQGGQS